MIPLKRYAAIILAAGSGRRLNLGYNKIFYAIDGIPIIIHAIRPFFHDPHCKQLLIVGKDDEMDSLKRLLQAHHLHDERTLYVPGGTERQHSVYNGLQQVKEEIVLIHDGARPFITPQLISTLYDKAKAVGAAVPGYPVKETIKVVQQRQIVKTLDRSVLYQVQTPQAIQTALIKKAHDWARQEGVLLRDDVSLIEHYHLSPVIVVDSSPMNIKITTPTDLIIARAIYEHERTGGQ